MNKGTSTYKIIRLVTGLVFMILTALVLLLISANRVGAHKSSTFGRVYRDFVNDWGDEVKNSPPSFYYIVVDTNVITKDSSVISERKEFIYPKGIKIHSTLHFDKQEKEWIVFNSYTVKSNDEYLFNPEDFKGKDVYMTLDAPEGTSILYGLALKINDKEIKSESFGKTFLIHSMASVEHFHSMTLSYQVHGLDSYTYRLSDYAEHVLESVVAEFELNSNEFTLVNNGFPNTVRTDEGGDVTIQFSANDLYKSNDIGLSFESRVMHLNEVQKMVSMAVISIVLFVLVVVLYSQIQDVRLWGVYYMFAVAIQLFYFLFLTYLVRFFGLYVSVSCSLLLVLIMATIFFSKIIGMKEYFRNIFPYLLLLTFGFTCVFLVPIFQGISFLILVFSVFLSLMFKVISSDFSKWYLLKDE